MAVVTLVGWRESTLNTLPSSAHWETVMFSLWTLLLPIVLLPSFLYARSSSGDSVLVVLDPNLSQDHFSIFFNNLKGRRYSSLSKARKFHKRDLLYSRAGISSHFPHNQRTHPVGVGGRHSNIFQCHPLCPRNQKLERFNFIMIIRTSNIFSFFRVSARYYSPILSCTSLGQHQPFARLVSQANASFVPRLRILFSTSTTWHSPRLALPKTRHTGHHHPYPNPAVGSNSCFDFGPHLVFRYSSGSR